MYAEMWSFFFVYKKIIWNQYSAVDLFKMNNNEPFSPFLNGLKNYPEKKHKDVAEIRKW